MEKLRNRHKGKKNLSSKMFSFTNFGLQWIGKEVDSKQLHQRTRFNTVMVSNANYSYSTKQNIFNSRGIKRVLTAGVACNVFLSSFALLFNREDCSIDLNLNLLFSSPRTWRCASWWWVEFKLSFSLVFSHLSK